MTEKERAEQFNQQMRELAYRLQADLDAMVKVFVASAQEVLDAMEK